MAHLKTNFVPKALIFKVFFINVPKSVKLSNINYLIYLKFCLIINIICNIYKYIMGISPTLTKIIDYLTIKKAPDKSEAIF